MIRADIISVVGRDYLTINIENDEYSYPKAFSSAALTFAPITNANGRKFEKLDIRFVKDGVVDLKFKDKDLIELLSHEKISQEPFEILQNFDIHKMDNMTLYIASNIVFIRKLISKLVSA